MMEQKLLDGYFEKPKINSLSILPILCDHKNLIKLFSHKTVFNHNLLEYNVI